jgi:D-galactose 1-dehydrogenase
VGIGKIARDQHIPAITANPDWELAAAVSRNSAVEGVEHFDHDGSAAGNPARTSPRCRSRSRHSRALPMPPRRSSRQECHAGKASGPEPGRMHALEALAKENGVTIFATWHSRDADCVPDAEGLAGGADHQALEITWKEDVRRWHPGQDWIWEPGGLGVFDPGINALSILTEILPYPVHVGKRA